MSTDHATDGGNVEYFSWAEAVALPDDVVRVETRAARIMLGPSGDGGIDLGLLVELPLPMGPVRVTLSPEQIAGIHSRLHTLLALNAEQVQDLCYQIHNQS